MDGASQDFAPEANGGRDAAAAVPEVPRGAGHAGPPQQAARVFGML